MEKQHLEMDAELYAYTTSEFSKAVIVMENDSGEEITITFFTQKSTQVSPVNKRSNKRPRTRISPAECELSNFLLYWEERRYERKSVTQFVRLNREEVYSLSQVASGEVSLDEPSFTMPLEFIAGIQYSESSGKR